MSMISSSAPTKGDVDGPMGLIREVLTQNGRLAVDVGTLADDADLYAAGLTSLATVGVMLALEDAFNIEFPESMFSRKTFYSFDSIAQAIDTLTK